MIADITTNVTPIMNIILNVNVFVLSMEHSSNDSMVYCGFVLLIERNVKKKQLR